MSQFHNPKYLELLHFLKHQYHPSATKGHFEFMMWLVNKYNPAVICELGCDFGHGCFAFSGEGIGKVYSVDTFCGDVHCGFRDTYSTVNKAHSDLLGVKLLQKNNVELIKGYFSEVAKSFDKKIDILFIDGLHTYNAVKEDFETWFPKTNDNAIVLFHDVTAFPDTVGKYFEGLPFPKTKMTHSAGLGVLSKNPMIIKEINDLWVNKLHYINPETLKHTDYPQFNIMKLF